jgi:hypothetical protein
LARLTSIVSSSNGNSFSAGGKLIYKPGSSLHATPETLNMAVIIMNHYMSTCEHKMYSPESAREGPHVRGQDISVNGEVILFRIMTRWTIYMNSAVRRLNELILNLIPQNMELTDEEISEIKMISYLNGKLLQITSQSKIPSFHWWLVEYYNKIVQDRLPELHQQVNILLIRIFSLTTDVVIGA